MDCVATLPSRVQHVLKHKYQVLSLKTAGALSLRCIILRNNNYEFSEARKKDKKLFHKKEFPETVVAGRIVVCDRRAARQA